MNAYSLVCGLENAIGFNFTMARLKMDSDKEVLANSDKI